MRSRAPLRTSSRGRLLSRGRLGVEQLLRLSAREIGVLDVARYPHGRGVRASGMIQHMKEHGLLDPGGTAEDPAVLEKGMLLQRAAGHCVIEPPDRQARASGWIMTVAVDGVHV